MAIDADTKLCVSYLVVGHDGWWATEFMKNIASRIHGLVQLTTDGHRSCLSAIDEASGGDLDNAQLQKFTERQTKATAATAPRPASAAT